MTCQPGSPYQQAAACNVWPVCRLKRAGLDYWPYVCVKVHDGWAQFLEYFDALPQPKRLVAFSKFSQHHYAVDGTYRAGEWLLFGAETHGLPEGVRLCVLYVFLSTGP